MGAVMIQQCRALSLVLGALLLALTVGAPSTRAQEPETRAWEALGPTDQVVWSLSTPTSGALFAATEQELFRSDDGGRSCATVQRPPETKPVAVSPVNHDLLYAGGPDGVHRSDDGGATWQRISDQAGGWDRIEVSPADPNVLYGDASAESVSSGVTIIQRERRVSHDGGVTWEVTRTGEERRVSTSYPCGHAVRVLQAHAVNPARLMTIEGCVVRGDPVAWMSYDEGRTSTLFPEVNPLEWSSNGLIGGRGADPSRWYVALFRANILYTRVFHSKLLRTDDDGASWTTVFEEDSGEPYSKERKAVDFVARVAYDPRRPDDVFAVFERYEPNTDRYKETDPVSYTVRASHDAGATWSELGARDLPKVHALAVGVDSRYLYAATRHGVYRLALTE